LTLRFNRLKCNYNAYWTKADFMYIQRTLEKYFIKARRQFPVMLLVGPRQVGKTTFLQHLCEKGRQYVTLDDPLVCSLAKQDPALFLQRFHPRC
jgi:predicted AAA+ superfamily ATPase